MNYINRPMFFAWMVLSLSGYLSIGLVYPVFAADNVYLLEVYNENQQQMSRLVQVKGPEVLQVGEPGVGVVFGVGATKLATISPAFDPDRLAARLPLREDLQITDLTSGQVLSKVRLEESIKTYQTYAVASELMQFSPNEDTLYFFSYKTKPFSFDMHAFDLSSGSMSLIAVPPQITALGVLKIADDIAVYDNNSLELHVYDRTEHTFLLRAPGVPPPWRNDAEAARKFRFETTIRAPRRQVLSIPEVGLVRAREQNKLERISSGPSGEDPQSNDGLGAFRQAVQIEQGQISGLPVVIYGIPSTEETLQLEKLVAYDAKANKIVAQVDLPSQSSSFVVSSDGSHVYCVSGPAFTLQKCDLRTQTFSTVSDLSGRQAIRYVPLAAR